MDQEKRNMLAHFGDDVPNARHPLLKPPIKMEIQKSTCVPIQSPWAPFMAYLLNTQRSWVLSCRYQEERSLHINKLEILLSAIAFFQKNQVYCHPQELLKNMVRRHLILYKRKDAPRVASSLLIK